MSKYISKPKHISKTCKHAQQNNSKREKIYVQESFWNQNVTLGMGSNQKVPKQTKQKYVHEIKMN